MKAIILILLLFLLNSCAAIFNQLYEFIKIYKTEPSTLIYNSNIWNFKYFKMFDPPPPTRDPVFKNNNAVGLVLPAYFQTGRTFSIRIVYRPTFYRLTAHSKFL